jgi:glycosyltransferase involved in cell wall biosynthesis
MTKNPKTVCIVSPFPPPFGGMAIQAEKIALHLLCEGFHDKLAVIRVKTNADLPENLRWAAKIPGFRTLINMILFLYQLHNALLKSDAVYFHTAFFNFFFWITYPAMILIRLHGKKVILSARGGGARLFFQKYRPIVKPILSKADIIATPSGFLKEAFEDVLGIDAIVIPTLTDLHQFQFHHRDSFRPLLLSVRNFEEIYDIACIIRAFEIVRNRYPQARLGIAGSGSLKSELESLVSSLNLNSSVTFYGQVSHKEIQELYSKYDIAVNASRVDNLPGTILEAYASGLPVVSTNAGGIPYIVEDGVTGLLVNIGDYEAMAQKVIQVIEEPELGKTLAKNAAQYCKIYDWNHVKTILMPLLDSMMKKEGGSE